MANTAEEVWQLLGELIAAQKETERIIKEQSLEAEQHLKETDHRMQETERIIKEQSQETDRRMQETDRRIKQVSKEIGKLGNRLGD